MLGSMVLTMVALVVGILEHNCDSSMSTWMIVYAIFPVICITLFCIIMYQIAIAAEVTLGDEETKKVVVGLGLIFLISGALLFHVCWLIYGMVIFWPEVSTNPCRTLVTVSTPMFDKKLPMVFLMLFNRLALSSWSSISSTTSSSWCCSASGRQ